MSDNSTDRPSPDPRLDEVPAVDGEPLFRDRDGHPLTVRRYAKLSSDLDYKIVARTVVGDREVVTAWLGSDQGPFSDDTRPLIFGTIDQVADRATETAADVDETVHGEEFSATESEARAVHDGRVARLRRQP